MEERMFRKDGDHNGAGLFYHIQKHARQITGGQWLRNYIWTSSGCEKYAGVGFSVLCSPHI